MLARLNDALPGLVATIIGYGLVIQFAGVWFVEDKAAYSIGLWYGIAIAVGLAIHIASVLWDAVSMGESKDANRRIDRKVPATVLRCGSSVNYIGLFSFRESVYRFSWGIGTKDRSLPSAAF